MLTRRLIGAAAGGASFAEQSEEDAMRGVSVKRTSNQTTPFDYYDATPPVGTATNNGVFEFDTEEYDDDGAWAIGSPTKFTIPSAWNGKRGVFYANCIWLNDSTYAELKIFKNGDLDNPVAVAQNTSNSFNTGVVCVSRPMALTTGDYFELCGKSGDTASALAAEAYSITFALEVRMA